MRRILRLAICEDDETQLEYIRSLVLSWAEKEKIPCEADGYTSAEQMMFSFPQDLPYSVYILDIQMGKMSGMELARQIREKDKEADILFLTGLRDYAIEGYEVGAVRYLIKPVKEDEFRAVLHEISEKKQKREDICFVLERRDSVLKIPYRDIWYLEAQGHYVELAYGEDKVQWKAGIGKLQPEFEENGFVMTRRGVLVNLARVAKVGKSECILDNGVSVLVSRNRYEKVNEAFIAYYRKRIDETK